MTRKGSPCIQLLKIESLFFSYGFPLQDMTPHAIYMRLKRLCEPTGTGRVQVAPEIAAQWKSGNRDQLTLALVKAMKAFGTGGDKKTRDAVRVGGCQTKVEDNILNIS